MKNKINLVSIVGPTASGKTKLSVELAKRFNGEIISADSMQIYRGMTIATAKPDEAEKQGIRHHLMDFLPPDKTYSVAQFVSDAKKCIADISERKKLPFLVGGTGLYVDSLLNNVSFSEETRDEALCNKLYAEYQQKGIDYLLDTLKAFDPESAERLAEGKNPKRIIRAIEFYKTTGKTITEQNRISMLEESPYNTVKIGINYKDREALYSRINRRVDIMLEQGLIEETRAVLNSPLSYTSVKAIGYKELEPYIKGEAELEICIEKLKRETRRYAKRQLTWFRRDNDINWLYADEFQTEQELIDAAVHIINEGLMYG